MEIEEVESNISLKSEIKVLQNLLKMKDETIEKLRARIKKRDAKLHEKNENRSYRQIEGRLRRDQ